MMNTLPLLASAILLCTQTFSSVDATHLKKPTDATLVSAKTIIPALPTMSDRKPSKKIMTASSPALLVPATESLPTPERWIF